METTRGSERASPTISSEAVLAMDRFVSASSAQDAISSLEKLVEAFKPKSVTSGSTGSNIETISWEPAWIFEHEEISEHLVWLLRHGTLKASTSANETGVPCEEGVHLTCQLYQYIGKTSEALMKPSPGSLLESLLDILDTGADGSEQVLQKHANKHPIYVRVLALKVLEDMSKRHQSIALNQWLQAPNGLHRIADLLTIDVDINPMEEPIRNQALIVAKSLAREAPIAKVFLFAEVECKLLDLCWKEGGLTKGSPIVIDALELIEELLKHADASLQDLVWQRPNLAPRLMQLLDLRGGEEFLHPKTKNDLKVSDTKNGENDDLESLLASGDSTNNSMQQGQTQDVPSPRLLSSEEAVVKAVLNILRLLLETDSVKETVWKQHMGLCTVVWDLALVSNPSNPPVCALPTPSLQQEALTLIAEKINSPDIMGRLSGLDRLLYLVCTGGGIAHKFDDKLGISQSSLAVLRQTLSGDRIHEILMNTLAPPPTEDENILPPGPTVVQKLWNTVKENLDIDSSEERTLFLSGALGGIGLLLHDEQSREIMFKLAPITLDQLLQSLPSETNSFVQCSILRFLCEWIYQCPLIAHNLLSSTSSTQLAGMAAAPGDYQSLTQLLLGLAMEGITNEEECGGWTRNGIIQIIIKIGISKYTTNLEGLKNNLSQKMPWNISAMETKTWKKFCNQAVLAIRKRVVLELAAGSTGLDDDGDYASGESEEPSALSGQGLKPLQKLVSQQVKEMEHMRLSLESAEARIASQELHLTTWKRRMESTPTELDGMLNELSSKNVQLEDKLRSMGLEFERQKCETDRELESARKRLEMSQEEATMLRNEEGEVKQTLRQTEEEMKALSEAYASLEEEFQKHQKHEELKATTAENHQEEQHEYISTEIATLRAETKRLKTDALKADEWMSMAVQKLNELGASNLELEKQITFLNGQVEESQAVAEKIALDDQSRVQKLEVVAAKFEAEKTLRLALEERLTSFENLESELERERQTTEQFRNRVAEAEQALCEYKKIESQMQDEEERFVALEQRLKDSEDQNINSLALLEREKKAKHEIEERLRIANESRVEYANLKDVGDSQILEPLPDYNEIIAAKDLEIAALKLSMEKMDNESRPDESWRESSTTSIAGQENVSSSQQSSQEEIYQLESVIRELKDRLGSGLGAYTVEDIRARDKEIQELRLANEDAQEWMEKAVQHHERNSAEIQKLSEEKAYLTIQLEEQLQRTSSDNMIPTPATQNAIVEEGQELRLLKEKYCALQAETEELRQEKETKQGLLDELGIAMDDVTRMQQQQLEYKTTISELEVKLSGHETIEENNQLRLLNEDLQKKVDEFEDWAQVAQARIADVMRAKDSAEEELQQLKEETQSLREGLHDRAITEHTENEKDARPHQDVEEDGTRCIPVSDKRVDELQDALKEAQDALEKDEDVVEQWKERAVELEMTIRSLQTELQENENEANEAINKWQESCASAEKKYLAIEQELNGLKAERQIQDLSVDKDDISSARFDSMVEAVKQKEEEIRQLRLELESTKVSYQKVKAKYFKLEYDFEDMITKKEERNEQCSNEYEEKILELNKLVECMREDLANQNVEAKTVMNEWTDKIATAERENSLLREKLDESRVHTEELGELRENLSHNNQILQQWEERAAELSESVKVLTDQLQQQEQEAFDAIGQWDKTCSDLESKCAILEDENTTISDTMSTYRWSMEQLKNSNDNCRREIQKLRIASEATEFSLREELNGAKSEISSALEALDSERKSATDERLRFQAELKATDDRHLEATTKIESMALNLEERKAASEDAIQQWAVRFGEIETAFKYAQQQLIDQENEANDAISSWETKNEELEKELDLAEDKILRLEEILVETDIDKEGSLVLAAEKLVKTNMELHKKIKSLEGLLQEMKFERDQLHQELPLKAQDALELERDRLIGVVAQLEEELREANAALQVCVTDESIDKATEFTASAIRDDMENLRDQLLACQEKFEDEKAAREVANLEVERLQEDIVTLISLSHYENTPFDTKKLTTKSVEKLQKIEHAEIDDLRKTLFRAMEEAQLSRTTERDSNETISKLRVQISIYEQEILATKSEVNFLSEAMEELRQAEDSKRASLEHRIRTVENENNFVRKYQANELEDLRKELAQISMEKDVIMHQLNETEKANESLIHASKREPNTNTKPHRDLYSECAKLRVENAHLLSIGAEDKCKAEKRLHELLSAQAASTELDVILERELRLSAETALQTLKEETEGLREGKHDPGFPAQTEPPTTEELNELKNSLESLKKLNAKLKVTIEQEATKSKQTIDLLTDECRKAQTKAFKVDRGMRADLAVQSEISKMKFLAISSPADENSLGVESAPNHQVMDFSSGSAAEAFRLILRQRQEIQEERMIYTETLQEQEDLLALVAQQDLEKSYLRDALIEVAGDEIANEAMKKAEEFAIIKYGDSAQVVN